MLEFSWCWNFVGVKVGILLKLVEKYEQQKVLGQALAGSGELSDKIKLLSAEVCILTKTTDDKIHILAICQCYDIFK